jgi:hypothetical protein
MLPSDQWRSYDHDPTGRVSEQLVMAKLLKQNFVATE